MKRTTKQLGDWAIHEETTQLIEALLSRVIGEMTLRAPDFNPDFINSAAYVWAGKYSMQRKSEHEASFLRKTLGIQEP